MESFPGNVVLILKQGPVICTHVVHSFTTLDMIRALIWSYNSVWYIRHEANHCLHELLICSNSICENLSTSIWFDLAEATWRPASPSLILPCLVWQKRIYFLISFCFVRIYNCNWLQNAQEDNLIYIYIYKLWNIYLYLSNIMKLDNEIYIERIPNQDVVPWLEKYYILFRSFHQLYVTSARSINICRTSYQWPSARLHYI